MNYQESNFHLRRRVMTAIKHLDKTQRHELFLRGFVANGEETFPNPEALYGVNKEPILNLTSRGIFPPKVIKVFREIARKHGFTMDIQSRSDLCPPLTRT